MTEKVNPYGDGKYDSAAETHLRVIRFESRTGGIGGGFALGHEPPDFDFEFPAVTETEVYDPNAVGPESDESITFQDPGS